MLLELFRSVLSAIPAGAALTPAAKLILMAAGACSATALMSLAALRWLRRLDENS